MRWHNNSSIRHCSEDGAHDSVFIEIELATAVTTATERHHLIDYFVVDLIFCMRSFRTNLVLNLSIIYHYLYKYFYY